MTDNIILLVKSIIWLKFMELINVLRKRCLLSGDTLDIYVSGSSMEPYIHDDDRITIANYKVLSIGDVIVYEYYGDILVHRILRIGKNFICCKGDNSFRIESVLPEDIIGRVISVNDYTIGRIPRALIFMSLMIGKAFMRKKKIERIKNSWWYRLYKRSIIQAAKTTGDKGDAGKRDR